MPPLDDLPGQLIIPERDDIRDQYLQDVRFRTPGAVTVQGTQEYADASVFADAISPVYFDAKNIGDHVAGTNKSGAALDIELVRSGTSRLLAAGGSGFVVVSTAKGGGTIFQGDEIKDERTNLRFQCTATKLYTDGQYVPIIGIDTGPTTNLNAGVELKWSSPRPGINPVSVIFQQSDGTGLSGGRLQESDDEANKRLQDLRANPPASGNDAEYQKAVLKVPGIPVGGAFTFPCCLGPGTIGVAFTLRPGVPGANRIPNATQMAQVYAYLVGKFPTADSIFMTTLVAFPVYPVFEVTWAPSAVGWIDVTPWPIRNSNAMVTVDSLITATTTTFRLSTTVPTINPQVGQSIAFYDQDNGVFRRKRIKTVTTISNGMSWDLVADPLNGASDVTYVPYSGQIVSPWSDSLQGLVTDVTAYFDGLGPGEQLSTFPDLNQRQRRTPRSPTVAGNTLTNRIVGPLLARSTIGDVDLVSPSIPYSTPSGARGIFAYLMSLGGIAAFPQQV